MSRASQVYIGTSDYEWSAGVIEDGDDTVKTDDTESVIKDTAWGQYHYQSFRYFGYCLVKVSA